MRLFSQPSRPRAIAWPWRWTHYEVSKRRELLAQRHNITLQKTWIYTNIPTEWLTCGAEPRRRLCFGIAVHPPVCRCWVSCRGSQRSALVRCMSVDNKERCEWLFHCCDQELITSSNIADNAMRLQMVTHPSNFRSQCCSYMDVFYNFIYVYCVRARARARARLHTNVSF